MKRKANRARNASKLLSIFGNLAKAAAAGSSVGQSESAQSTANTDAAPKKKDCAKPCGRK